MPGVGQSGFPYPGLAFKDLSLAWEQMRNFGGGEDSYDDPIDLAATVSQRLINVCVRDKAKARTRAGADPIGGAAVAAGKTVQGLFFFTTPAFNLILAAAGGAVYQWNGELWTALKGWAMAGTTEPLAGAQGVDTMLFSDGVGNLQVWDGASYHDAGNDPVTSPPLGATILTYHVGRMLASGVAAYPDTIWVSLRLGGGEGVGFGAGQWNATTRSFRVGNGEGDPIMGIASAWQYVAVVLKLNSIWYCNMDPTAEPANFKASQDTESVSYGIGCVGRKAWCMYGNDILFLSQDGIRSVQRMQAAVAQYQLSAPMSRPVQYWIDQINWQYANTTVACKYAEFAFFSIPIGTATSPNCTLVWNGRLGCWLGAWQGWTPTAFCYPNPRFNGVTNLVFGDSLGLVNQWKDQNPNDLDETYEDNGVQFPSWLYTRSFTFNDLESPKTGFTARVRFNMGNAPITVTGVGDDASWNPFSTNLTPTGSELGTGRLGTFQLAAEAPVMVPFSLRGQNAFNELYLEIGSPTGWWELRNLTCGARVRPLKTK